MRLALVAFALCSFMLVGASSMQAQEKHEPKADAKHDGKAAHAPKYKAEVKTKGQKTEDRSFDLSKDEHQKALLDAILAGDLEAMQLDEPPNPMAIVWDLGVWAIVVFILLLLILRKAAWGPMLEGLQKREESILSAVEE